MSVFIDSHAHLDGPDFDTDREQVIERARTAGLTHLICIGASDGFESNERTLALVDGQNGFYATVGIHPHDAQIVDEPMLNTLETMARHPQVVAIGETGLDYYYDQSPREAQRKAFASFMTLAQKVGKPIIVHTRDAEEDTIQLLKDSQADQTGGVLHCFTGTQALADAAIALGFYISFSGIVTFKSAEALREVARNLPRERVLVETDCPYLAPVPKRGKRNEPSFIVHTVNQLANLWQLDPSEVRAITGNNAMRFFHIGDDSPSLTTT